MTRTPEPPDFPASQLFLRRLAFSLVHDEARAEDLVQDTWAAWAEHRPSSLAEPKAWLARVLRNRAFNAKRADERRTRRESLHGRPDPSTPETDGTLEAQAQLIEALRKLDEPYRSTLVQRYYHDLAPKEIAERSGAPLNTIKARLARGLARLREELDRRYGGDRSAWCHWLTVLGAPPVPVVGPAGSTGAPQGAAPFAGMGGGLSLTGWLALAVALAAVAAWRSGWLRSPPVEQQSQAESRESAPALERFHAREPERVPLQTEDPVPRAVQAKRPAPTQESSPLPEVTSAVPSVRPEAFDWLQYAGGPDHNNHRHRDDPIRVPWVEWFVPGLAGQPTLAGGELYSGGAALFRLDAQSGKVFEGSSLRVEIEALVASGGAEQERLAALQATLEGLEDAPNDASLHSIAAAPVLTKDSVLARRLRDGGVSAFDRRLERELWSWDPDPDSPPRPEYARIPLCLADGRLLLVAQGTQLIALTVADGREQWRFPCNDWISTPPASAGGRAFFGTERGQFFAVGLRHGEKLWEATADSFGPHAPVVVGERVLVAEQGGNASPGPSARLYLRAFDVKSGWEAWRSAFEGSRLSSLGIGGDGPEVFAGSAAAVVSFDLGSGKRDPGKRISVGGDPYGTITVVGKHLLFASHGHLYAHDLAGDARAYADETLWTFQAPGGAAVLDFVHAGERIFVSTSVGLFCLAQGLADPRPGLGLSLGWNRDTTVAWSRPKKQ